MACLVSLLVGILGTPGGGRWVAGRGQWAVGGQSDETIYSSS